MEYELLNVINQVIKECEERGCSEIQFGKDACGDPDYWLSAEYVYYDSQHDIIELSIHYRDTGRVAYSIYIKETIKEVNR